MLRRWPPRDSPPTRSRFTSPTWADFVIDAVETSKAVGKPVKVVWSREDDMQHDYYRPISYARMWGAVDASGKPTVFKQHIVQQSLMKRIGGLPPNGVDFISVDGSANLPYDIPNIRVEYTENDPGIPFGFWRSVGASFQGFVVEAFIDEMAAAAKKDPFEFRRELLAGKPRHLKVLETAAREAGWGQPLPAGSGRGIALRASFGSIVAQVAEVVVADGNTLQVKRVTCAIDCGPVVNPAIVRAQMESGIIYGLSAALYGEITLANGAVEQSNFPDYDAVRLADAPAMTVHLVDTGSSSIGGVGEPGTPPIAPAVANAVFAATGKRLRNLPLRLG